MADNFKKPEKIQYEPIGQEPYDPAKFEDKILTNEFEDADPVETRASIVVDEYNRTIEFYKFIEGILRDVSKVEVEVNPQDDPEVWMAMTRIFSNPTPKLNQDSYFQVLDALEVIERIESAEDSPRSSDDFLANLPNIKEAAEGEVTDSDFQISAIDEIVLKSQVRRKNPINNEPADATDSKPPDNLPDLRRWRKTIRTIDVLGKKYKIQGD